MKKPVSVIAVLIVLVVFSGSAFAQRTAPEWVARYDGDIDAGSRSTAMAVDGLGNIYVTGSLTLYVGQYHIDTVKYDTNGTELWSVSFSGEDKTENTVKDIAVDTAGNVYVTGFSGAYPLVNDYVTIKYDTNGTELWVAMYNGPGNGKDEAQAIALDGAGNVYVTGNSERSTDNEDYATIKYDTDGNQLWVARYNGPGNGADRATALAVDGAGNIYVTGESDQGGINHDYGTIKYDTDGNQLWLANYGESGYRFDIPTAIALDSQGNVHVTGYSGTYGFHYFATLKYDTDGNQLWLALNYDRLPGDAEPTAIALDSQGNVYVTGEFENADWSSHYTTIKFDMDGQQLWLAKYTGPDDSSNRAEAIAVDSRGNVYVTGSSDGDYATVFYTPSGVQLSVERYNGPNDWSDKAYAIALDGKGRVIVSGTSFLTSDNVDFVTIKYRLLNTMTVASSLNCTPTSGTVPFATTLSASLWHDCPHQIRRIAARIDLITGSGISFHNWRAGFTNVAGGSEFNIDLQTTIPALVPMIGNNIFTLTAKDVTPPPYNQSPYPSAGASNSSNCVVAAFKP